MKTTANPLDSQSQSARFFSGVRNKSGVSGSRICMPKPGVGEKKFLNYAALENKRVFIEDVLERKSRPDHSIGNLARFENTQVGSYTLLSNEEEIKKMISNADRINKHNINYINTIYLKAFVLPGFPFNKPVDAKLGMEKKITEEEKIILDVIANSDVSDLEKCVQIAIENELKNFTLTYQQTLIIEDLVDRMTKKFSNDNFTKINGYIPAIKEDIKTKAAIFSLYNRINSSFMEAGKPLRDFIFE